jgi:subtilisin
MPAQGAAAPFPIVLRYAVLLERGADTVPIVAAWARWGCERVFLAPPIAAVRCPIARTDSLGKLPGVKGVMFDEIVPLPDPDLPPAMMGDAPQEVVPWNLTMIAADTAWGRGVTGAGVVVGIMDSGIDSLHPDLNVVGGRNFAAANGGPEAWGDTFAPCNGHGTHVAGSVGSNRHGVAPGAGVYALRVMEDINGNCSAWKSSQNAAVVWAGDNGIAVVNASLGGSFNFYQSTMMDAYVAGGGVFVAASGNAGAATALCPACYPATISVGAVNSGGVVEGYSNRDPALDLTAPGGGIESSMPGGGSGWKSGTSMASPHVAGVVALLRSLRPTLSPDSVRALLHASAVDGGPIGHDAAYGHGRVDVRRLFALVIPRAPMVPAPPPTPIGETRCVPVASATPWIATTSGTIAVWQSGSSLCWRGDAAGSFTIRLRST